MLKIFRHLFNYKFETNSKNLYLLGLHLFNSFENLSISSSNQINCRRKAKRNKLYIFLKVLQNESFYFT